MYVSFPIGQHLARMHESPISAKAEAEAGAKVKATAKAKAVDFWLLTPTSCAYLAS